MSSARNGEGAFAWSSLRRLTAWSFLGAVITVSVLSGWITLDEGTSRFLWPFTLDDPARHVAGAVLAVREEPTSENMRAVSVELWGLAKLTSVQRFADSKLPDQGAYYARMPTLNQVLLLLHVLLSFACMLFGALQFWPWFRKRYMRMHRVIGAIYLFTVPPAVLLAMAYMAVTPPHRLYDHLTAWLALHWAPLSQPLVVAQTVTDFVESLTRREATS